MAKKRRRRHVTRNYRTRLYGGFISPVHNAKSYKTEEEYIKAVYRKNKNLIDEVYGGFGASPYQVFRQRYLERKQIKRDANIRKELGKNVDYNKLTYEEKRRVDPSRTSIMKSLTNSNEFTSEEERAERVFKDYLPKDREIADRIRKALGKKKLPMQDAWAWDNDMQMFVYKGEGPLKNKLAIKFNAPDIYKQSGGLFRIFNVETLEEL